MESSVAVARNPPSSDRNFGNVISARRLPSGRLREEAREKLTELLKTTARGGKFVDGSSLRQIAFANR